MDNKVLIKITILDLDESFDLFIPVNEVVWKLKKLIIRSISDLTGSNLNIDNDYILINKNTGKIYNSNDIVINTDIRNGSELFILSKPNL